MKTIKSISFTDEYLSELAFLNSKDNRSRYICNLIRRDMRGEEVVDRAYIERIIDSKLNTLRISGEDTGANEEIRDNLIGLFGGF